MRRSQPIDMSNEKLLAKLGIDKETEEQRAAGREVVKVEIVDEMFDFSHLKPNLWVKTLRPFRRLKIRIGAFKQSVKHFWQWRKLFEDYYPWDIYAFLPLFIKHLELYIECEKKHGIAAPECRDYKISTAQEAADIMKRLVADNYTDSYTDAVEEKWGQFPYEKTTYADGSVGFNHLTPDGYDTDMRAAYEKADKEEQYDLKRLGEIMEENMFDWWD